MRGDDDRPGFYTTAVSKPPLIQSLRLAFEQNSLKIIADNTTISELESFTENRSIITGNPQYGAPAGMHDDTVIALALAWRLCMNSVSSIEMIDNHEYTINGQQPF